jgi:hypothetical protein
VPFTSRFAEYGLTGGFFWICQLPLIWWHLPILVSKLQTLEQLAGTSDILRSIIISLVSALAIVAVFVAGLLLDLLAIRFVVLEMIVFKRHLDRNRGWVIGLVRSQSEYCGADYDELQEKITETSIRKLWGGFDEFIFWKPAWWQRVQRSTRQDRLTWKLVWPYERLWSFFASYVVVLSGSSQLDLMMNQYYLWRTARAISTALLILFLEAIAIVVGSAMLESSAFVFAIQRPSPLFVSILLVFGILGILTLAVSIVLGTYSRLCHTLFSLVYVTHQKLAGSNKAS